MAIESTGDRSPAVEERVGPLRLAWRGALAGWVLVGTSFAIVILGSRTANKPHEVRGEGLFFFSLGLHALLGALVLVCIWKALRARGRWGPARVLSLLFAASYGGLVALYFGRVLWSVLT